MILSIINHKGGVGKTMTTHNLGAALAQMKKRVLMVDFDPQCNLTQHCGVDTTAPMTTISDYLNDDDREYLPIEVNKYLHLIPSADGLDADSMNMAAMDDPVEAATLLRSILGRVGEQYDYILVDGAPGSGMLMLNAHEQPPGIHHPHRRGRGPEPRRGAPRLHGRPPRRYPHRCISSLWRISKITEIYKPQITRIKQIYY